MLEFQWQLSGGLCERVLTAKKATVNSVPPNAPSLPQS
jgi:hypothetical protein